MQNLKYDTSEPIYETNKIKDIANRLVVANREEGGRVQHWEFGISRCKLVYAEWLNNKVLPYSTGNYNQYPMMSHNGKEYEKKYIQDSGKKTSGYNQKIIVLRAFKMIQIQHLFSKGNESRNILGGKVFTAPSVEG